MTGKRVASPSKLARRYAEKGAWGFSFGVDFSTTNLTFFHFHGAGVPNIGPLAAKELGEFIVARAEHVLARRAAAYERRKQRLTSRTRVCM